MGAQGNIALWGRNLSSQGGAMSLAGRNPMSLRTLTKAAALAVIMVASSSCAGGTSGSQSGSTCPATDPQCAEDQTVIIGPAEPGNLDQDGNGPGDDWDNFPSDDARDQARSLLGMDESDLPDDVRIGRKGDETFMLTEDYVLGRNTVELDDTVGGYKVVSVRVELPDGPEVFTVQD
jgi:hypothetical protein